MSFQSKQPWLRSSHFYALVLCNGLAICFLMLSLPDLGAEAFGGVGVPEAESRASFWIGISQGAKSFASLVMGPMLASRSDMHGRKGFVVGAEVACLVSYLPLLAPVGSVEAFAALLVLNALSGAVPILPALLAVVADDQPPDRRAQGFGWLLAAFDVSFLMMPIFGSRLTPQSTNAIICASGVLSLVLAMSYGESLPMEQRIRAEEPGQETSLKWWKPKHNVSILVSTPLFRRLSVVVLCSTLVMAGTQQCFLFFMEASFGLNRAAASSFIAILALTGLVVQALLLPLLVKSQGLGRTLLIGVIFQVIQNLVYVSVHSEAAVALGCAMGGFGSLVFPAVSALKSLGAPEDQQGRVQGAVSSLQSFAMGIGAVIYGAVFAALRGSSDTRLTFALSLVVLLPAAIVAVSLLHYVADERSLPLPRRNVSAWQRNVRGRILSDCDEAPPVVT